MGTRTGEYGELRADFATFDSGDAWGNCMGWWFAIAGEMFKRGDAIPPEWGYRPSPLGAVDTDQFEAEIVAEYSSATLLEFGRVLDRYASKLKRAGHSY